MRTTDNIAVIDKYLSIVKSYYPDVSADTITVFQDGYDHDVLLINTRQAFRFPRTKDHGKKDLVENIFLREFAPSSPITVQEMTGQADPKTGIEYQMCRYIQGVQLSTKIASTLTEQELANIAIDMGKFLTTLHSFSLVEARSMGMDELDPKTYWKYFESLFGKISVTIFSLLSTNEQRWIEELVKDYVSITRDNPFELRVTHSDLLAEHIVVDETTHKLNGVISLCVSLILQMTLNFLIDMHPFSSKQSTRTIYL